jgi:hypothetical protein
LSGFVTVQQHAAVMLARTRSPAIVRIIDK